MAKILCVYYSRTGRTEALMKEIAGELDCECVKLADGVDRRGLSGWLTSGLQAVSRKVPEVVKPETAHPLKHYDLVIIGSPVWAGRCSAPVRSFLMQFGDQLKETAYVITRGCGVRYEEVFEQMDLYVRKPHLRAVTIQPGTIGSDFWRDDFLTGLREMEREDDHAG